MKPILTLLLVLCVHRASLVQTHAAEATNPNILFTIAGDLNKTVDFSIILDKGDRVVSAAGGQMETQDFRPPHDKELIFTRLPRLGLCGA